MPELMTLPIAAPNAEAHAAPELPERASLGTRLVTLVAITLPVVGLVAAPFFLWDRGFHWVDLGLLLGMIFLTGLGITVGYHRLFTHRSFETYAIVKFALAVFGSMAVQGPVLQWTATHRRHHRFSDSPEDPHTPHHSGRGLLGLLRGAWHAHIGWFFRRDPKNLYQYVPDLRKSFTLRSASALFPLWVALGLLLPAVLGGIISGSWMGVWSGLIWGGLVRVLVVHHSTWSINSACHLWGQRPYRSGDQSRNNIVFGILALGEGWHNSHHAFPTSARHGLRWWQIDMSYWFIRALALIRLAWDVRLPSPAAQRRERRIV